MRFLLSWEIEVGFSDLDDCEAVLLDVIQVIELEHATVCRTRVVVLERSENMTADEVVDCHDDSDGQRDYEYDCHVIRFHVNSNAHLASLRSLIKKKYVKVGEIVYSGTVLARSYVPLVSKEEYLESRCQVLTQISSSSIPMLMVSFINEQKDEQMLDEMEKMIAQRRKEIEKGK